MSQEVDLMYDVYEMKDMLSEDVPYNFNKQQLQRHQTDRCDCDKTPPVLCLHKKDKDLFASTAIYSCVSLCWFFTIVFMIGLYVLYFELTNFLVEVSNSTRT